MRLTLAVSIGVALAALTGNTAWAQSGSEKIKVGALLPLTGPGASFGVSFMAGLNATIAQVNREGGILGRQMELVSADDQGDPTRGVSEARRLGQVEKVSFVLGSIATAVTVATLPVFTEAKVLQFSSAIAKEATPERGPYHFTTFNPAAEAQAENFIDYILNHTKFKKVAILSDSTPLYKNVTEATLLVAKEKGVTITSAQEYQPREPDLVPHMLAARRSDPELVWVTGILLSDAVTAIKAAREIGLKAPLAFGLQGAGAAQLPTLLKPEEIPNYVAQVYAGTTFCTGDPLSQKPIPRTLTWLKAHVADFDKQQPAGLITAYDTIMILRQVYTAAGTTDTVAAAGWIKRNAPQLQSVQFVRFEAATEKSHFLVGRNAMAMSENPHIRREDGLVKRVGC